MKKLLVQVSVTEKDYLLNRSALRASIGNALMGLVCEVKVLVVYQTSRGEPLDDFFADNPNVFVRCTSVFGVSHARNLGLDYARSNNYEYIIFHDSSNVMTVNFVYFINQVLDEGGLIAKGKIAWVDDVLRCDNSAQVVTQLKQVKLNPIYNSYVCLFVFNLVCLDGMRFNEFMGPGRHTVLNAGEDVFFFYELLRRNPGLLTYECATALVNHLERPKDNSKQLNYAEAQGVLLRWFLARSEVQLSRWSVFFYCIAFFSNAVLRLLIFKPNSYRILFLRIKGFLDPSNKRRFIG